jgi:probable HAF family extracellular repeat protein
MYHPVLPAGMSDLQVYIETALPGTEWVLKRVYDINSSGQIVGSGTYMGNKAAFRLTLPADALALPSIENLGVPGTPTSINNDGDVAGHFADDDSIRHAFLWRPETGPVDLGVYAWDGAIASTYVTAINDRDAAGDIQVVGYARRNQTMADDFYYLHAWRFETAFALEGFQNLGVLSGTNPNGTSSCFDVNNLGEIAGYHKYESLDWQGFVYSDLDGLQNVGPIGGKASLAYGINDFGDVVGMTDTATGRKNEHQAFVMTDADGLFKLEPQIVDLPASMEFQITPWRINSLGQIIGSGYPFPNPPQGVAFLLTPL